MPDKMVLAPNIPPPQAEPAHTHEGSRSSRSASFEAPAFCRKCEILRDDPGSRQDPDSGNDQAHEGCPSSPPEPEDQHLPIADNLVGIPIIRRRRTRSSSEATSLTIVVRENATDSHGERIGVVISTRPLPRVGGES